MKQLTSLSLPPCVSWPFISHLANLESFKAAGHIVGQPRFVSRWLLEVLTLSLLHPAQLGFSGPAHFNESLLCPIKTL